MRTSAVLANPSLNQHRIDRVRANARHRHNSILACAAISRGECPNNSEQSEPRRLSGPHRTSVPIRFPCLTLARATSEDSSIIRSAIDTTFLSLITHRSIQLRPVMIRKRENGKLSLFAKSICDESPNHAMERTPDRCASTFEMTSTFQLPATRGLVRRRSSCSR
jgi:hypothetical protein